MLHTLSLTQVIDLWADLERCREGSHGFGGDVGEFYTYRMMPSCPSLEFNRGRDYRGSMFAPEIILAYENANLAFKALLGMFQARRGVEVTVETQEGFVPLEKWDVVQCRFEHRMHVKVRRTE
jgi:hypothetical protein